MNTISPNAERAQVATVNVTPADELAEGGASSFCVSAGDGVLGAVEGESVEVGGNSGGGLVGGDSVGRGVVGDGGDANEPHG